MNGAQKQPPIGCGRTEHGRRKAKMKLVVGGGPSCQLQVGLNAILIIKGGGPIYQSQPKSPDNSLFYFIELLHEGSEPKK